MENKSRKIIATANVDTDVAVFEKYNQIPLYILKILKGEMIIGCIHDKKLHDETFTIKTNGYFILTYENRFSYEEFDSQKEYNKKEIKHDDLKVCDQWFVPMLLV